MRPRQATGRPDTPVIPPWWAESHQPVLEASMGDATCEIREPGTVQAWNPVTEQNDLAAKTPYYTGGCRVSSRTNDARLVVTAEDPETVTRYIVTIPADEDPETGHLVTMTATDDPALTGRTLVVTDVVLGSHRFERDLICTLTD